MTVTATVLFDRPQREVASLLEQQFFQCTSASLVVGFATVEGIAAIEPAVASAPKKLKTFVLGASTFRGFEALEQLLAKGVSPTSVLVHLGHTRPLRKSFQKYHPMLHSKVYLFEHANGRAVAIIGSHNLTGFALFGHNGEAAVMLEGAAGDPEFNKIRAHIDEARHQAIAYRPEMKAALNWWATQFIDGLRRKINDRPDDSEPKRTIVILSAEVHGDMPKKGDVIYFELPNGLGQIASLSAEVHIYVFDRLPANVSDALSALPTAKRSFWCKTLGLEQERGGVELNVNWEISGNRPPLLRRAPKPFRPQLSQDMQQVRVKVWNSVQDRFEYQFDPGGDTWEPEYDREHPLGDDPRRAELLRSLDLNPPEDGDWFLVRGLTDAGHRQTKRYLAAREELSPSSQSYVLFSSRRRNLSEAERAKENGGDYLLAPRGQGDDGGR